jgi:hypothetical protein
MVVRLWCATVTCLSGGIQTGIGEVEIKVPKVRDRSGFGINFTSALLPPYLKRSGSIEALLPWLYHPPDTTRRPSALPSDQAKGLSANTLCRLKQSWTDEYREWSLQDLTDRRYVYWWVDGIAARGICVADVGGEHREVQGWSTVTGRVRQVRRLSRYIRFYNK